MHAGWMTDMDGSRLTGWNFGHIAEGQVGDNKKYILI